MTKKGLSILMFISDNNTLHKQLKKLFFNSYLILKTKLNYILINSKSYKAVNRICGFVILLWFISIDVYGLNFKANSNSVMKVFDYTAVLNDGIYNEDEMNATFATANITIQNQTFNGVQKDLVINGVTLADSITPVSGSVYRLKNVKNDFFLRGLNTTSNSSGNNAYITFYKSRPTWSTQKWIITKYSNQLNKYEIKNQYSGRALRGFDPNSVETAQKGSRVTVFDPEIRSDMIWEFIPVEGLENTYHIKNNYSGLYLSANTTRGDYAIQTLYTDDEDICWELVPCLNSFESDFLPDVQNLQLSSIFRDSMVVQQNDSIAFFGKAVPSQQVIVETSWGTETSAIANGEGYWKMKILTPAASFDPQIIQVSTNTDTVVFKDVLVGEVWLCSGQSNMLFELKSDDNGESEIMNANNVSLRLFHILPNSYPEPKENIENTQWLSCSTTSLESFSAVAYYFGKSLSEALSDTPIGIISAAFGGASAESFISKEAMLSKNYLAEHYHNYIASVESKVPTACYNAMIHPLIPYTIKGIIWYQGEANCVRASHYYEALETMITSRRLEFESVDLPFYIVQLPPFNYNMKQQEFDDKFSAATVREAQLKISENVESTGIVVTSDVGNVNDIHPSNKRPIGERLAKLALYKSYGQKDKVFSGPRYKSHTIKGDVIRLKFDFVDNGIKDVGEEELKWFAIAGSDKKFYKGHAIIDGRDILVSSSYVKNPISVRFAWYNTAVPNFFNVEGLPASPFKLDNWNIITYDTGINTWSLLPN
ncbi:hypothetical protein MHL31_07850 [Lutibacter sp. A80]|uniref:sialate O-acetylesterase n=1 Tax=Lutibacter sp. A80 TaxID=2918453 RepID=UPI001F066F49|nr:sialate O-acetylesterase [Lutibacter sp. A80]UMB62097.1 hypothetical protein MHL31_07850 [Lutibacter sp. A80]